MKLFISGHNGLLGSACVRRLGLKHEIITFNGNILDSSLFNTWLKWHKPDGIIHCAAKVGGVKANRDEPVQFISQNLKLQEAVIGEAHRLGINMVVFIATSCLFPKDAPVPVKKAHSLPARLNHLFKPTLSPNWQDGHFARPIANNTAGTT